MWIVECVKRASYLIGVIALLVACDGTRSGRDCSGAPGFTYYAIQQYSMQFKVYLPEKNLAGESTQPYKSATTIDALDFALQLDSMIDWGALTKKPDNQLRFHWLAEAYACSPATDKIPVQRISRYEITSTGSFGDGFMPGADIKTLFLEEYRYAPDAESILKFIDGGITDEEIPPMVQTLRLLAIPVDTDHVFTITIELDDGDSYQFVSPVIRFNLKE